MILLHSMTAIYTTRAFSCRRHNIKLIFSAACKLHMEGNREEYSTPIDIESNLTEEILRLEYLNH
jgi:hypothetical protein